MSASRTRRQMIQRMGRILRRKEPGISARFVIMFAEDTLEDPANRVDRDGFLDEIERIAEATGVFDAAHFAELDAFLVHPGPTTVPEPERLDAHRRVAAAATAGLEAATLDEIVDALARTFGAELAYAYLVFAGTGGREAVSTGALAEVARRVLGPRLPQAAPDIAPYLEPELADLPLIAQPKVVPRRLSTGQSPLAITAVDSSWQLSCTVCGEASPAVRFRWQVFEQTVACRCA
jgi:hypothetical protein